MVSRPDDNPALAIALAGKYHCCRKVSGRRARSSRTGGPLNTFRAIFEHGLLRPIEPLSLREGEEVSIIIQTEEERFRAALADIATFPDPSRGEIDDEALYAELDSEGNEGISLSDAIIEER